MVKHILGVGIYEIIVVFVIVFAGEHFIPESDEKYAVYGQDFFTSESDLDKLTFDCSLKEATHAYDFAKEDLIFPGRLYDWENKPLYKCFKELLGNSRHFTFIFNTFIYMQVFNMFNARKIYDEKNVFDGISTNKYFLGVWTVIAFFQIVITQFTGKVFEVADNGLSWQQWLISVGIGFGSLIVGLLLKFLPDSIFPDLGKKSHEHIVVDWQKKDISDISVGSIRGRGRRGSIHQHVSHRLGALNHSVQSHRPHHGSNVSFYKHH